MPSGYGRAVRALGGFLAVCLCVGAALAQESGSPSKDTTQAQQTAPEQAEAAAPPRGASAEQKQPPARNEGNPEQDSDYYTKADLAAQERMAVGTEELVRLTDRQNLITAIEAGLLFLTVVFSAWASIAASKAATAADKAVKITSDTAQSQLRAYVSSQKFIWMSYEEHQASAGYRLVIVWENCGATPARRVRAVTTATLKLVEIPAGFKYPDSKASAGMATETSTIGPGQTFGSAVRVSVEEAQAVARGETKLIVWGWIEYSDIFNGTDRRRTEICAVVSISADCTSCSPAVIGPFNGADEDCHQKPKT